MLQPCQCKLHLNIAILWFFLHVSTLSSFWLAYLLTSFWSSVVTGIYFFLSIVPFDEDEKDPSVWFLDHDYLENMYGMFKKVNGMSKINVVPS